MTVPLLQTEGLQVAAPEAVHISSNGSVKLQPKAADETPVRRERNWKIATRVFALLAMLALGAAYFKRSAIEPRAMRLAFVPPENLRFENGQCDYVRVSPDGQKIVFAGADRKTANGSFGCARWMQRKRNRCLKRMVQANLSGRRTVAQLASLLTGR